MMIADVLTKLREMKGYTMKEVAEGIGAKPDTYRSYERGRLQPSLETVAKLARFYRVSANCLLEIDPISDIEYNDEFESELIEQYKQLPKDIRATILQAILNAAQKCEHQEESTQPIAKSNGYINIQKTDLREQIKFAKDGNPFLIPDSEIEDAIKNSAPITPDYFED